MACVGLISPDSINAWSQWMQPIAWCVSLQMSQIEYMRLPPRTQGVWNVDLHRIC
ncbi:uncharacterized protein PHACADRAFT_174689, partial [Phanerochaete carnosa HHB-10118-sp]